MKKLKTKFEGPQHSPGYLLWRISMEWRSLIEDILKTYNLTHPQFVVLATTAWLTQNNAHVSQIDIGRASALDPNTTSQILRSLEMKNFITRKQTKDERSKNPQLTPLGHTIIEQAFPAVEKQDMKFFELLTLKEQENLIVLFQKLLQ